MNKKLALPLAAFLLLAFGGLILAGDFPVKAGDKVYVCACGDKCDCGTVSKKAGKCGCGHDLVETTVTKVEEGSFNATVGGKERTFKLRPTTCAVAVKAAITSP